MQHHLINLSKRFIFLPTLFQPTLHFAAVPITETETKQETLIQRSTKERPNAWADRSTNTPLTRSKSMEFLPRQKTVSTSALRELFESKSVPKSLHKPKSPDKPRRTPVTENAAINHKRTEDLLVFIEAEDDDNVKKSVELPNEKEENVTPKVPWMAYQVDIKN